MSTTALMTRDDARMDVSFTSFAQAQKEAALSQSALVGKVTSKDENDLAVAAQLALRTVLRMAEDARKACKEPVLDFGRRIDAVAKTFKGEVEREEIRVATLIGNYQQAQLAKQRAAEAAAREELARIDRERQAELAKAKDLEEMERVNAKHDEIAKAVAPPVVAARAAGQVVREQWVIRSLNECQLARAHPELISKIVFDLVALKALLNATGGKVAGVVAEKEVVATVRTKPGTIVNV